MISWRLKHRLFGWHYVHLKNTATEIIRRVRQTACGQRYVVYFGQHLVFIDKDNCGWTVTELTSRHRIWAGPWTAAATAPVKEEASHG
ncbi:hypothetical protein [Brevundimonas sp.]|uniref:hypothetical protein n=1 Tax=Brevundimonas sp. TaxID=1871086 RepID=UPI0028A1F6C8|nr:hypothetical protein [Brevundimonas sp.]